MKHAIPDRFGRESRMLVLGAGPIRFDWPNAIHTDRHPTEGQALLEITDVPWKIDGRPVEDGSFDLVVAHNVFEHLPACDLPNGLDAFVAAMNESHRVLRSGGLLDIELPHAKSLWAITHPGHRRLFVPQTFAFFLTPDHDWDFMAEPPGAWNGYDLEYPVAKWELERFEKSEGGSLFLIMLRKPEKPASAGGYL